MCMSKDVYEDLHLRKPRAHDDYTIVIPPSTAITWPVI